jgi:plasmid stability protein
MAQLIIRDLDDSLLVRLKRRAWEKGLPLEESLRRLILAGLEADDGQLDDFFPVLEPPHPHLARDMTEATKRMNCHS